MRIMFLSHMPEDAASQARSAKVLALLQSYASPGTEFELGFPDDYPGARASVDLTTRNVVPELHHLFQTPTIVRKMVWAEQQGFDAVLMSNTFDPGVEAGRQAVQIPVIGVLRTTLHVGATLTSAIVVIVPLEEHIEYTWRKIRGYGMQDFVRDVRAVGLYSEDAAQRRDEIFERAVAVMQTTIRETRAQCLIPLGGAVFPYIVDTADLQAAVGLPVLNTKAIGVRFAEMCVTLGLRHPFPSHPTARLRLEDLSAMAY
jgi:Asp/Glu/hydantoin racemase